MKNIFLFFAIFAFLGACEEEKVNYTPEEPEKLTDEIDLYFKTHFLDEYGTAVRWKWVDRLVSDEKRVTPPLREVCKPMGEFIRNFWLAPFNVTEAGQKFMKDHFPPEIALVGSPMYNKDGSVTLGYADAGVRITFTQVNEYKENKHSVAWHLFQLRTAEHEYGHIIHQQHDLPDGYEDVTPGNYKSNNWLNLAGDVQSSSPRISREAIAAGMVSNYGTSDENEDFCELLSIYLTSDKDAFYARYITHEPTEEYEVVNDKGETVVVQPKSDAVEMNAGRDFIAIKLNMIKNYYSENFNIDLDQVRDEVMLRINNIGKTE